MRDVTDDDHDCDAEDHEWSEGEDANEWQELEEKNVPEAPHYVRGKTRRRKLHFFDRVQYNLVVPPPPP